MTVADSHRVWMVGGDVRGFAEMQGRETVGLRPEQTDFRYSKCQGRLASEVRPPEMSRIAHCPGTSASEQ